MSRRTVDPTKAVAYLRVSTDEQHLGTEAQRAQILAWGRGPGGATGTPMSRRTLDPSKAAPQGGLFDSAAEARQRDVRLANVLHCLLFIGALSWVDHLLVYGAVLTTWLVVNREHHE